MSGESRNLLLLENIMCEVMDLMISIIKSQNSASQFSIFWHLNDNSISRGTSKIHVIDEKS